MTTCQSRFHPLVCSPPNLPSTFTFQRRRIPASACQPVRLPAVLPSDRPETRRTGHAAVRCTSNTHSDGQQAAARLFRLLIILTPVSVFSAGKAMWERLTAPEDGFSKLQRENLAIIESYGKALMEVVCRDACDGHEISRVRSICVCVCER